MQFQNREIKDILKVPKTSVKTEKLPEKKLEKKPKKKPQRYETLPEIKKVEAGMNVTKDAKESDSEGSESDEPDPEL